MASKKYVPGKFFTGLSCKNGHIAERWNYNGMCVDCKRETDKSSNIKAGKKYRVKKEYGLTVEQVEKISKMQDGKCAICNEVLGSTHHAQIDHCHVTGNVRGLLCINCNWMLGKSRDKPDLLRAAANYLEKTKESECLTNL